MRAVLLAAALALCAAAAEALDEARLYEHDDGSTWLYRLVAPDDLAPGAPQLWHLPGGHGDPYKCLDPEKARGWDALALAEGFALVVPCAAPADDAAWNVCSSKSPPNDCAQPLGWPYFNPPPQTADDNGMFVGLHAEIDDELLTDEWFMLGVSRGAVKTRTFACEFGHLLTAIAGHAGTLAAEDCAGAAVPFLFDHGTDDTMMPWPAGGYGNPYGWGGPWPSPRDAARTQALFNGCSPYGPTQTIFAPDVIRYDFRNCAAPGGIILYPGGHGWPAWGLTAYLWHEFFALYVD